MTAARGTFNPIHLPPHARPVESGFLPVRAFVVAWFHSRSVCKRPSRSSRSSVRRPCHRELWCRRLPHKEPQTRIADDPTARNPQTTPPCALWFLVPTAPFRFSLPPPHSRGSPDEQCHQTRSRH